MAHSITSAPSPVQSYYCPMHPDVHQTAPGTCAKCGMDLMAEGTRFAWLRHMAANPLHLIAMAMLMVAVMAAVMMVVRAAG